LAYFSRQVRINIRFCWGGRLKAEELFYSLYRMRIRQFFRLTDFLEKFLLENISSEPEMMKSIEIIHEKYSFIADFHWKNSKNSKHVNFIHSKTISP
jgi:hypothetical protein